MPYYAWSEIRHTDSDGKHTVVARGEKVEKSKFKGMSDADWQAMVDGGSIREKPFPAPEDYDGSAIDYLRDQLQEAQAVSTVDEEEAASELVEVQAEATKLEKSSTDKK
jgi:nitrogen regulatory protein PII-like uncharacterized protein